MPSYQFTNMKKYSVMVFAAMWSLAAGMSNAAQLDLADEPLYLGGVVDPNVMFILDDSGSMHWENMPSNDREHVYVYPNGSRGVYRGSGSDTGDYTEYVPYFSNALIWSVQARSTHINKLYYNPDVRYIPWPGTDSDGHTMTNMDPQCALHNGYEPDADNDGGTVPEPPTPFDGSGHDGVSDDCRNLTIFNRERAHWTDNASGSDDVYHTFWPAVYYRYTGGDEDLTTSYQEVEIRPGTNSYPKAVTRTDCSGSTCTYAEEIQNFANWYSYYRSRILMARGGIGRAFAQQSTNMRVGFASINDTAGTDTLIRGVRKFEDNSTNGINGDVNDYRSEWFDLLYGHRMPTSGTPLRTALEDIGNYYRRDTATGPWAAWPGIGRADTDLDGDLDADDDLTCRQSYTVLMSDGFWNGGDPGVGNSDNTSTPADQAIENHITNRAADNYRYIAGAPYSDSHDDTLADVAMEFWKTDLRPDMDNEVPPNPQDDSFWQHMVTYTVGLGVEGELGVADTITDIANGDDPEWPEPCDGCEEENIDDMWHAAVNSRGEFFSASDPDSFADSLSAVLIDLTSRTSSAASVALNSSSYVTDSTVYQARFETGNWTGQLIAYSVNKTPIQETLNGCPVFTEHGYRISFDTDCNEVLDANGCTVLLDTDDNPVEVDSACQLIDDNDDPILDENNDPLIAGAGTGLARYVRDDEDGILYKIEFTEDWGHEPDWDGIPSDHDSRHIVTHNGTNGIPFRWANLTTDQKTALNNTESLLNYLRGDDSYEGVLYRSRTRLLGDIINSSPVFVGAPNEKYPDDWTPGSQPEDSVPYSEFRTAKATRQEVIYVGANDGMLHAFDASQQSTAGDELAAYIPNAIINKLPNLAATPYAHEYFLDGSPEVKDAFFGSAWHTVLVSSLGAGGQGIFALDVTNPSSTFNSETSFAGKVLWEFTDENHAELGYTFGRPNIVRLKDNATGGVWAAVFGNGYNNTVDDDGDGDSTNDSTSGDAHLFIVRLSDGALLKAISTNTGKAEDPTTNVADAKRPNGLGNVTPIDFNQDGTTDYVYAGDLFGNVWKFDLSSGDSSQWDVAYGGNPLFTARAVQSDATTAQPITSRITVAKHPLNYGGFMVYFGTGKYLEEGDNDRTGQDTQTLYGIWDRNFATLDTFDRDDLLQQQIADEISTTSGNFRVITNNPILYHAQQNMTGNNPPDADSTTPTSAGTSTHLGWYIDLINMGANSPQNYGEKIVSNPIIRVNRLIVNTLIPSRDPCDFGGESWGLEPDLVTGGPVFETTFDLNDDGSFNFEDYVALDASGNYVSVDADGDGVIDSQFDADGDGIPDSPSSLIPVAGKKIESGIAATPTMLRDSDTEKDYKIDSTSKGILEVLSSPDALEKGRQSWIELFR